MDRFPRIAGGSGPAGLGAAVGDAAEQVTGRKVLDAEFARYLNANLFSRHIPLSFMPIGHVRPSASVGDIPVVAKNVSDKSYATWTNALNAMDAQTLAARIYVANSGAPTHTSNGGFQKMGAGGGTVTWVSSYDVTPDGVSAMASTANGRINIQRAGLYLVSGCVTFGAIGSSTTTTIATPYVDGSRAALGGQFVGRTGALASWFSETMSLSAGSFVELYSFQNESVSEAYTVSDHWRNFLSAVYVGASS